MSDVTPPLTNVRLQGVQAGKFYIKIINMATFINPLAPNDVYISRTAQLTSRRCILNIYLTNIITEYFKHAAHSPFFSLFKMLFIS